MLTHTLLVRYHALVNSSLAGAIRPIWEWVALVSPWAFTQSPLLNGGFGLVRRATPSSRQYHVPLIRSYVNECWAADIEWNVTLRVGGEPKAYSQYITGVLSMPGA
ncbi:MAG TPA: hypothetical protein VFW03_26530 [Gemmatimonadaceae bacterium]|nr:hypothetical protein [Gemmatimonadaceae bacterium]